MQLKSLQEINEIRRSQTSKQSLDAEHIKADESICNLGTLIMSLRKYLQSWDAEHKLTKVYAILGRCLTVSVPLTQVDHYESIRLGRIQMAAATEMVLG